MKAIVIDDSRAIRVILRRLLAELGFDTIGEAAHGKEALARLAEMGAVDLALVDWNMPEMNGIDLVEAIRKERCFDGMRLLMVTTETEAPQMTKALAAGVDEYLMKPFTKDGLLSKLQLMGLAEV